MAANYDSHHERRQEGSLSRYFERVRPGAFTYHPVSGQQQQQQQQAHSQYRGMVTRYTTTTSDKLRRVCVGGSPRITIAGLIIGLSVVLLVFSTFTAPPTLGLMALKQSIYSGKKETCGDYQALFLDVLRTENYWERVGGMQKEDLALSRSVCERDGNCFVAKVYNGQLYIRTPVPEPHPFQTRLESVLMLFAKTDLTASPNVDFLVDLNDGPRTNEPCFLEACKHVDAIHSKSRHTFSHFLIPAFDFYTWWEAKLPSFQGALHTLGDTHGNYSAKSPKLVWRGTTKLQQGNERVDLVDILGPLTDIADVESVEVDDDAEGGPKHYRSLDQMCEYKYIVYTEGVTYSGRLKYTSLCNSVQIGLKTHFVEFWSHLIMEDLYVEVPDWHAAADKVRAWESSGDPDPERIANETSERMRREVTSRGINCYIQRLIEGVAKSIRWTVLDPAQDVKSHIEKPKFDRKFQFVEVEHFITEMMRYGSLESLQKTASGDD